MYKMYRNVCFHGYCFLHCRALDAATVASLYSKKIDSINLDTTVYYYDFDEEASYSKYISIL